MHFGNLNIMFASLIFTEVEKPCTISCGIRALKFISIWFGVTKDPAMF
jgi:hypothetical protein